jgi:ribosomal protein L11 methyltransferase
MIEEYSDVEENLMTVYGELIDEKILSADKNIAYVSIFVAPERNFTDYTAFMKERFAALEIADRINMTVDGVEEEDWANAWKTYYKPVHIGNHLVVVPAWQKYDAKEDEITIKMDPGMAFGTGTHETTRLCAAMVEKHMQKGDRVLDVGTGSGILSLFALKLGAASANAYDIDPVAVRVAKENAKDNEVDNFECGVSDLLADVDRSGGKYDFAMANIVADILCRMAPDVPSCLKKGGKIVCSGIINIRSEEVKEAMTKAGLTLVDEASENDWLVLVFEN